MYVFTMCKPIILAEILYMQLRANFIRPTPSIIVNVNITTHTNILGTQIRIANFYCS